MDREQILSEIRRCAAENGGKALGRKAFLRETGIKANWVDDHWLRWSDAVDEAGFSPNSMNAPYSDDYLLELLATLTRELGHYPIQNELNHKGAKTPGFPDPSTFRNKFGQKAAAMRKLAEFCSLRPEFADVVALLGDLPTEVATSRPAALTGYVYLAKSGKHYKIGQTNDLVRRTGEIRIQLPQRMELVHQISTDDPIGIERYWHQRFDHLRTNGEWFALGAAEVAIFRRRRFM